MIKSRFALENCCLNVAVAAKNVLKVAVVSSPFVNQLHVFPSMILS